MKRNFTKLKVGLLASAIMATFSAAPALAQGLNYRIADAVNTTTTYTDLGTSGTAITVANNDDANSAPIPIGFTFNYNRLAFTHFVLNTNGYIRLGNSAPSSPGLLNAIGSPLSADANILAAFSNVDLHGAIDQTASPTSFRVATTGTAPNRVTTIQFKNLTDKPTVSGTTTIPSQLTTMEFQIKLYETTNVIEFVYGTFTATANNASGQPFIIGIKGANSAVPSRVLAFKGSSAAAWSTTTFLAEDPATPGALVAHFVRNTFLPDAGRTYRFVPFTFPANDLSVVRVYALGKIPTLATANASVARAAIINVGTTTKTNVTVSLAVTGSNTFNTTATIASIAGGDTAYVTFPAYNVTATGTNTLTVTVPADDVAGNNTGTFTQLATNTEASHAVGNPPVHTTAIRPLAPNGTLLAKFNVTGSTFLESVNMMVSFHQPSVGQTIYAVVYNSAGTQIGRSPDHVVQTIDLSQLKNFKLNTPVTLPAGDFYVGMAVVASAAAFFPLGVQDEEPVRPNTFFTNPIAGGALIPLRGDYRLIIEPILTNCLTPATPTVTPTGNAVFCAGTSLTLTGSSTTSGVTYQWYRNGIAIAGATGTTTSVNTVGNYTLVAINGACTSAPSAVVNVTTNTPVTPTITAGGPTSFCQNSGVVLTGASTASNLTYQWNRDGVAIPGATAISLTVNTSGVYTFTTTNSSSCSAVSSDITVTVTPMPPVPTITQNGGTLTSSATSGNQWYRNSFAIPGATGQTLVTTQNGAYTVEVTDNNCKSGQSNLVNVLNTGLGDALAGMSVQVYPNPASGSFTVKLNGYEKDATVALYSLTGQLLLSENVKATASGRNFDAKGLAAGTYVLKVTSPKGVQVSRLVIE